jgi:hypothetical protein
VIALVGADEGASNVTPLAARFAGLRPGSSGGMSHIPIRVPALGEGGGDHFGPIVHLTGPRELVHDG